MSELKCPMSGIECIECGYAKGCALQDIVQALEGIAATINHLSKVISEIELN